MYRTCRSARFGSRGFTIRDLAVTLTGLLIAGTLLASLAGANRDLSQATVCATNLKQLFEGLTNYVNQYNSFPPHNPYPQAWWPPGTTNQQVNGLTLGGWDPNLGWILTYGLGLEPPERFDNGHFKWFGLSWDDVPGVVKCPATRLGLMDPNDPEIDTTAPLESFVYTYALSYQTSGTCRSATPLIRTRQGGTAGLGGRNPPIPDPRFGASSKNPQDNANYGIPYVWLETKTGAPDDPNAGAENYPACWVQAVHPGEVQSPARLYYLADSRDYRPRPPDDPYNWPPAGINDGWPNGWGNKVFLGARHYGYANVLYLDGHVTRDNQTHVARWNMNYDPATGQALSNQWRCSTFATNVSLAHISTQAHTMPVLMVKGWEYFFDEHGVAAK